MRIFQKTSAKDKKHPLYLCSQNCKVRVKKMRHIKKLAISKNSTICFYSLETLWKWLPHEVNIFTNFHEDSTKNVDFLVKANFWTCLTFLTQTLVRIGWLHNSSLLWTPYPLLWRNLWIELTPSKNKNLDNAELLAKGVIFMPLRASSLRNFASVHFSFCMLCFSDTKKRGKRPIFFSY